MIDLSKKSAWSSTARISVREEGGDHDYFLKVSLGTAASMYKICPENGINIIQVVRGERAEPRVSGEYRCMLELYSTMPASDRPTPQGLGPMRRQ